MGRFLRSIYLGHAFKTDLLLLRLQLASPLSTSPQGPWLHDPLRTLAEALALSASLELDIDPNELNTGYRLMPSDPSGAQHAAYTVQYDTASGGAGYAMDAGEVIAARDWPTAFDEVARWVHQHD